MASTTALGRILRFGAFELNVAVGELRKHGVRLKLRPQATKVLVLLVRHSGEIVTREQLKQEIWGSAFFVDFEHGLNLCIRQIRAVLDDDPDKPRYIETIPRQGYRFIARVEEAPTPLAVPAQSAPATNDGVSTTVLIGQPGASGKISFWPRRMLMSVAAVSFVIAVSWIVSRPRSALVSATEWVQITNFAGSVTSPALSPDGRMLTFLRGDETFVTAGEVYVMLLPHGDPVQLTHDSSTKMSPVFTPDGASIDYTVPWDTWTVPVLGGQPRLRLSNASGLTWLGPDSLMFSQILGGIHMGVASSDLGRIHVRSVYTPESSLGMAHRSYLSPDGKWVIVVEMPANFWDRCRLIPFDGSSRGTQIGPADGACSAAAWSPNGRWMYLNTSSRGGAFHIWRQRFPNGRIEQVTSGPTEEEGIAVAPNGKAIITAVGMRRTSVWLHDSRGDRALTSEGSAALPDPRNGSPFSVDGKKLYYVVRHSPWRAAVADREIGEVWELDLQSGATRPILPGFSIHDFSLSPDGQQVAFTALDENSTSSIWVASLDGSSSPRMLQRSAEHPRFTSDFIYYIKRGSEGSYAHRIRSDGSGDQQIWNDDIVTMATSPDGRYLAVTLPIRKGGEWNLELVDWAQKKVQPVCKDAMVYWSDDGRSLYVFAGFGKGNRDAPTYLLNLAAGHGVPELPPAGVPDIAHLVSVTNARTLAAHAVAAGRVPGTYAYVKETVQRDLYRIPLH